MKVGIDARFYGPIGKGLGRYTQEIVDNIILINSSLGKNDFDFVIFLSKENFDEFEITQPNIKKVLLKAKWYSWQEQLLLPWYIWREHLDLIHFPHFNIPIFTPTKFVMTLHDLILTHFPTTRATTKSKIVYWLKNLAYRLVIRVALYRAVRIITVSQFTKNDIIAKFPHVAKKIVVTYEGVANLSVGKDALFLAKNNFQAIRAQYNLGEKFLLYVGNAYPHKNLDTLIKVFSRLYSLRPDLKLVLVGKEDYFYDQLRVLAKSLNLWQLNNKNNAVIFPGYISDSQLEVMYQEAKAYIFPSLYEGFGLPPLEAMGKGCPVLSSDRASLPEILGPAAIYFNPEDEADMLAKIIKLLDDNDLQEEMRKRGIRQSGLYSWQECALATFHIYQQAMNINEHEK